MSDRKDLEDLLGIPILPDIPSIEEDTEAYFQSLEDGEEDYDEDDLHR